MTKTFPLLCGAALLALCGCSTQPDDAPGVNFAQMQTIPVNVRSVDVRLPAGGSEGDFVVDPVVPAQNYFHSRFAPRGMTGTMVGVYYTHLFFANMGVGWLGGQYEKMSASAFWTMHAAIVGVSAVLLLVRLTVGRGLTPAYDAPAEARA